MERDKTDKKYLKLYYEWMMTMRIPSNGLCSIFGSDELFQLIDPEDGQYISYWGHEREDFVSDMEKWHEFTALRQNVVLLMAAMNNEL